MCSNLKAEVFKTIIFTLVVFYWVKFGLFLNLYSIMINDELRFPGEYEVNDAKINNSSKKKQIMAKL